MELIAYIWVKSNKLALEKFLPTTVDALVGKKRIQYKKIVL